MTGLAQVTPPIRRFKAIAARVLPVIAWTLLLLWASRHIDWTLFIQHLSDLPPRAVAGIAAFALIATCLQGLRFRTLLPAGLSLWRHIGLSFSLQAGNILLPARSGELVRPFYLHRWNLKIPTRQLIGWSVADKVFEAVSLLPFILAMLLVFNDDPAFASTLRWGRPALAIFSLVIAPLGFFRLRRELKKDLGAAAPEGLVQKCLTGFLISLGAWTMNLFIFRCAVPQMHLALALLVGVNLAAAIPALPAGMGAFQAAFVWVGAMGGLGREEALALSVVVHVTQILSTLLVGLPILLAWGWPRRGDDVV